MKIMVYVDSIEQWQEIEENNLKQINEYRGKVTTRNNTTVTRIVKAVENQEDIRPNGSIYLIKKA